MLHMSTISTEDALNECIARHKNPRVVRGSSFLLVSVTLGRFSATTGPMTRVDDIYLPLVEIQLEGLLQWSFTY